MAHRLARVVPLGAVAVGLRLGIDLRMHRMDLERLAITDPRELREEEPRPGIHPHRVLPLDELVLLAEAAGMIRHRGVGQLPVEVPRRARAAARNSASLSRPPSHDSRPASLRIVPPNSSNWPIIISAGTPGGTTSPPLPPKIPPRYCTSPKQRSLCLIASAFACGPPAECPTKNSGATANSV